MIAENILCIDVVSMYPTIIECSNILPESIDVVDIDNHDLIIARFCSIEYHVGLIMKGQVISL